MTDQHSSAKRATLAGDESYAAAITRFSKTKTAHDYPSEYRSTFRDRRESAAIRKVLRGVPPGSHVLDLPCGSGRLVSLLLKAGYRVTGADSAELMVERARARWQELSAVVKLDRPEPRYFISDVMQTGFADGEFDAVICNRLIHHFSESATRVAALKELRRISKGPVAVSFFNSFAIDAVRFRLKQAFRKRVLGGRKVRNDRLPISMTGFLSDMREAGLDVYQTVPVLYGVSPMWYVVACPRKQNVERTKAA